MHEIFPRRTYQAYVPHWSSSSSRFTREDRRTGIARSDRPPTELVVDGEYLIAGELVADELPRYGVHVQYPVHDIHHRRLSTRMGNELKST